eukprot:6231704-Prorocentrum_lima.AAC.1
MGRVASSTVAERSELHGTGIGHLETHSFGVLAAAMDSQPPQPKLVGFATLKLQLAGGGLIH